uniref:3-ketoacyl-CoA reductase isoform 1 n=1 Tax=Rhizophora mucronata TaxID=61149 RepID=A0A2P2P3R2_RHIMU
MLTIAPFFLFNIPGKTARVILVVPSTLTLIKFFNNSSSNS